MTKAEIVDKIGRDAKITTKAAELALGSFITGVRDSLKKGKTVTLVGFGTFGVVRRATRTGRHPQTGAVIKIKAARVPRFKASKTLKAAVSGFGLGPKGYELTSPMPILHSKRAQKLLRKAIQDVDEGRTTPLT